MVADALYRVLSSEIFCMDITSVSTDLYPLIAATWTSDTQLQDLILNLQRDPLTPSNFSWIGGQLRRKDNLVIRIDAALKAHIIHLFHDTSTRVALVF